jgi:acyl-CoA thioester hydrolase
MLAQHDIQIRVRYQETDGQGRLHHANYFTYFEMGRTELLREAGLSYREFEAAGLMLVVSEITCQYLAPASYDDVLTLRTTTAAARGARVTHDYHLLRGEELLATGRSVVACINRDGRATRLPDFLLE